MKAYYITYTGEKVYPSDLTGLNINLIDIAHHLTNIQRFGGALPFTIKYNVAEHSISMALYALKKYGKKAAAMCLLHDASEAYLGDIVSPLKKTLTEYQELEIMLSYMIYKKYKIDMRYDLCTHIIDASILLDEVRCLIPDRLHLFDPACSVPLGIHIEPNRPEEDTEQHFLDLCQQLGIKD